MTVFDAITLVNVIACHDSAAERAFWKALREGGVAVSDAVEMEFLRAVTRPYIARYMEADLRNEALELMLAAMTRVDTQERVRECRDAKDDRYLELALACNARTIVSMDDDLLSLGRWRGIRIMPPERFLQSQGAQQQGMPAS